MPAIFIPFAGMAGSYNFFATSFSASSGVGCVLRTMVRRAHPTMMLYQSVAATFLSASSDKSSSDTRCALSRFG